jgi:hypothetical protein
VGLRAGLDVCEKSRPHRDSITPTTTTTTTTTNNNNNNNNKMVHIHLSQYVNKKLYWNQGVHRGREVMACRPDIKIKSKKRKGAN